MSTTQTSTPSESTTPRSPIETVRHFFRMVVEGTRDDMADCYAPDVRVEMPWAPGGVPAVTEGREEMRARMKAVAGLWDFESVDGVTLHQTADPEVVVAEYRVHGRVGASGETFSLGYVCIIRVVDGLIADSRDYGNPVEGAAVMKLLGLSEV